MQTTPTPRMTVAALDDLVYDTYTYYELFDGELVMHDNLNEHSWSFSLYAFFSGFQGSRGGPRPSHLMEWRVDDHNLFRPHVVFTPRSISGKPDDGDHPVLAVDMLPQSNPVPNPYRVAAYAAAGLPWYWAVDSETPSITIHKLVAGELVVQTTVTGDEVYQVDEPFPIKLCPARQWGK